MLDDKGRYILELPEMESQHAYLYSLLDRLEKTPQVTDQAAMKWLCAEIERTVLFHFSCEQHLMRLYHFAGFASHQSDHERAEGRLVSFLDDFEAGCLNPMAMYMTLTGWLMEHSVACDAEYVAWIVKCRNPLLA